MYITRARDGPICIYIHINLIRFYCKVILGDIYIGDELLVTAFDAAGLKRCEAESGQGTNLCSNGKSLNSVWISHYNVGWYGLSISNVSGATIEDW